MSAIATRANTGARRRMGRNLLSLWATLGFGRRLAPSRTGPASRAWRNAPWSATTVAACAGATTSTMWLRAHRTIVLPLFRFLLALGRIKLAISTHFEPGPGEVDLDDVSDLDRA